MMTLVDIILILWPLAFFMFISKNVKNDANQTAWIFIIGLAMTISIICGTYLFTM